MHTLLKSLITGGTLALALFATAGSAEAATKVVQPGDTLARLFPTSWQAVCAHYGINCNLIYPGQVYSDDGLGGATTAVAGVSTSQPSYSAPAGNRAVPTYLAVGKPYVYGAAGPYEFDCSGLTQYLARQMGFSIGRTSWDQMYAGRPASRGELLPGDLIIMRGGGHVGMYIGNNQMIQALNPSQGILISSVEYGTAYNPVHSYRALGH